jgi:CheY-like chemotaxis protein
MPPAVFFVARFLLREVYETPLSIRSVRLLLDKGTNMLSGLALCDPRMSTTGLRILVVEDDPNHRKLARQVLEDCGHVVTDADDGEEALAHLDTRDYDLVVLDMRLPGMDGREFIRRVRHSGREYADIPIIVMTGYGLGQHMELFRRYDIHDYMDKPYDSDLLLDRIHHYQHRT